ncbi:MAG: acylphosphatase [Chlamydiota bacterium]
MHRLTIIFSGQVQGVGFRREAQKKALELRITGSIQNCLDGSVKAVIEGEISALFALIQALTISFPLTDIKITFDPSSEDMQGFLILR